MAPDARHEPPEHEPPEHEPPEHEPPDQREMLELPRDDCLALLASGSVGRLAVTMADGAPIIRPVNYRFDKPSQSVVFRTAPGSKLHALLRSTRAAFEIDGIDHDSPTGWSVIIAGVTQEVTNPRHVRRLDGLGLESWTPGEKFHWVQIRARTVSGRRTVLAAGVSRKP